LKFEIFHPPFTGFISRCFVSLRGSFAGLSNEERSTKSHERTQRRMANQK
jgi:hypothetical protein